MSVIKVGLENIPTESIRLGAAGWEGTLPGQGTTPGSQPCCLQADSEKRAARYSSGPGCTASSRKMMDHSETGYVWAKIRSRKSGIEKNYFPLTN